MWITDATTRRSRFLATHSHVFWSSGAANCGAGGDSPIAEGAEVYFIWPKDGAVMKSRSFRVIIGLRKSGIAPAGTERDNTGYHHLIIDSELPLFDEEIPSDRNHVHFGKGQSETLVELSPGTHTLPLLFADHFHIPHSMPTFSEKIIITVP